MPLVRALHSKVYFVIRFGDIWVGYVIWGQIRNKIGRRFLLDWIWDTEYFLYRVGKAIWMMHIRFLQWHLRVYVMFKTTLNIHFIFHKIISLVKRKFVDTNIDKVSIWKSIQFFWETYVEHKSLKNRGCPFRLQKILCCLMAAFLSFITLIEYIMFVKCLLWL